MNWERLAMDDIRAALADTPVVLIHGPRQAGKSWLAKRAAEARSGGAYVTLDDLLSLDLAESDPEEFLRAHGTPLVIDEVQRAPRLLLAIKAAVDRKREPGMYLLTGSANVLTLPKVADTLVGRMEVIDLLPLSQAEMGGRPERFLERAFSEERFASVTPAPPAEVMERVVRGGFPEAAARPAGSRRDAWFRSYVRTLIERDVRSLSNIDGLSQVPRLLNLLATRSGTLLNVSSISRETEIPATTLTRYLALLGSLFLVQPVPAWSFNRGLPLIKAPKAYLVDSGLLCHLTRRTTASMAADRNQFGAALEAFVAMELRKLANASPLRPTIQHLRSVRGKEVGFVLELGDGKIVGIEVKAGQTASPADFGGLRFLRELAGDRFVKGILLYCGEETRPAESNLWAVPITALWS